MFSIDFEKSLYTFSDPRVLQNGAGPYVIHSFCNIDLKSLEPQGRCKIVPDLMFSNDSVKSMSNIRDSRVMPGPYVFHVKPIPKIIGSRMVQNDAGPYIILDFEK